MTPPPPMKTFAQFAEFIQPPPTAPNGLTLSELLAIAEKRPGKTEVGGYPVEPSLDLIAALRDDLERLTEAREACKTRMRNGGYVVPLKYTEKELRIVRKLARPTSKMLHAQRA